MGLKRENWIWMPHAAHFICGSECKFHLSTYVGTYLVSTVGEWLPDAPVREIFAATRKIELTKIGDARLDEYLRKVGFEEVGFGRKYETMVFKAARSAKKDSCCPWIQANGTDVDFQGYNDPVAASKGHLVMCKKWAAKFFIPTRKKTNDE